MVPGSPWEKVSAAQIKKWKIATKKAMALPLGGTTVSVVRIEVLQTPFDLQTWFHFKRIKVSKWKLQLFCLSNIWKVKQRGRGIFILAAPAAAAVHIFTSEANPKSNTKSAKKVKKAGKASFRRGHGKRAKVGGDVFDGVPEMPPMPPPLSEDEDSHDESDEHVDGSVDAGPPKDRVWNCKPILFLKFK